MALAPASTPSGPPPVRLTWSLSEVVAATGLSLATWKRVIARGELPTIKSGRRTLILDSDLRDWLMNHRSARGKAA